MGAAGAKGKGIPVGVGCKAAVYQSSRLALLAAKGGGRPSDFVLAQSCQRQDLPDRLTLMDWDWTLERSGLPAAVMALPVGWLVLSAVFAGLVLFLLVRVVLGLRSAMAPSGPTILVDGSNVIYWDSETPSLAPLRALLAELQQRGQRPGVVFDANAGYKIATRYLHDGELARLLDLPERQVMVVPKGRQADEFLLRAAREMGAKVVTNDRYRDWEDRYPEVREANFLVRGGYRGGAIWLNEGARP